MVVTEAELHDYKGLMLTFLKLTLSSTFANNVVLHCFLVLPNWVMNVHLFFRKARKIYMNLCKTKTSPGAEMQKNDSAALGEMAIKIVFLKCDLDKFHTNTVGIQFNE